MADDDSSSLPPRRLGSLADDDDDLEEGQFVPAAYQSSSDHGGDQAPAPPAARLQHARRPGRLSMEDVLALGRGDALPSPTPSSCGSEGTISDDGVPSPASVFRTQPKRKRVVVALDGGWAATGKRGWAGGKQPAAAAAPTLNNPQSTSHSSVSGDSSSSASAQAVVVHHKPPEAAADHHPPRRVYTCKECGKTYTTNQALGGHAAGHRNRQKEDEAVAAAAAMMPQLGEGGAAAFLAALRRTRREEAPHECRKCHKVFATGVALGGHMRVHYTGPPIVPARKNKKRRCLPLQPPVGYIAAVAAPPPGLSLALSMKAEEAPSSPAPPGGVSRVVRLFGIDISPQVQAPSEPPPLTEDFSSTRGQQ